MALGYFFNKNQLSVTKSLPISLEGHNAKRNQYQERFIWNH